MTLNSLSIKLGERQRVCHERFIEEIRRREKVVRIFPNKKSVWRPVGALCAEKHEEWSTGRRYLTMDEFYRWKADQDSPQNQRGPLPMAD